jgi:hypothetical protein
MTCNEKTVSKVIGCGMILKMIRDKYVVWEMRVEAIIGRTDRDHQA